MRVVTTCHKEGFEGYGFRCLEGWKLWPRSAELYWHTEGYGVDGPRVTSIENTKVQGLQIFKERYGHHAPPSYLYDVVRFSHKVYAAYDALFDYRGIAVWLDADCVTFKGIPEGFIESLIPKDCYMSIFDRKGMYTETGFWIMDCSHPQHQAFLSTWVEWYETGAFKGLANWTDCETLDATLRKFKRDQLIKTHSLSGEHANFHHPMSRSQLGEYIDHTKGGRKADGVSPENAAHVAEGMSRSMAMASAHRKAACSR